MERRRSTERSPREPQVTLRPALQGSQSKVGPNGVVRSLQSGRQPKTGVQSARHALLKKRIRRLWQASVLKQLRLMERLDAPAVTAFRQCFEPPAALSPPPVPGTYTFSPDRGSVGRRVTPIFDLKTSDLAHVLHVAAYERRADSYRMGGHGHIKILDPNPALLEVCLDCPESLAHLVCPQCSRKLIEEDSRPTEQPFPPVRFRKPRQAVGNLCDNRLR